MDEKDFLNLFISLLASVIFTLFVYEHLKKNLEDAYIGIAEECIKNFDLPEDTSPAKILRFAYFIFSGILFVIYVKTPTLLMPVIFAIPAAVISPPIILLILVIFAFSIWHTLAFLFDLILFVAYVPSKMYRDRENPSIKQFRMFVSYLMVLVFIWGIIWGYLK